MSENDAALYEEPFRWVRERVLPSLHGYTARPPKQTSSGRFGSETQSRGPVPATRRARRSRRSPFPAGLMPNVPASSYAADPRAAAIAEARGAAGQVAQPARMGRLGARAGPRISEAAGSPRRGRGRGCREFRPGRPRGTRLQRFSRASQAEGFAADEPSEHPDPRRLEGDGVATSPPVCAGSRVSARDRPRPGQPRPRRASPVRRTPRRPASPRVRAAG